MNTDQKKMSSMLILLVIISFSFGVATMNMDENGNMSDCPFTGTAAICPMSFSEHIATFQSIFRTIPPKTVLLVMFILASLLTIYPKTIPRIYSLSKLLPLSRNNPELFWADKLLLALSDGIIQPKLYV